jgi:DNA replicative helicase MCM subunit Mcm2 (Cdc46/Mcm family)
MEVIFRNDIVEQARAGDKLVFVGNLVVVPDVSVITAPGQRNVVKGAGVHLSGYPCSKNACIAKVVSSQAEQHLIVLRTQGSRVLSTVEGIYPRGVNLAWSLQCHHGRIAASSL